MEISEFIQLIKRKKQTIFAIVLLFLLFGTLFTLITPKKYTSKSKLLVVQGVSKDFDLYAVSKSNSYLSKVLANVIESNTFYVQTLNSDFDIEKSYFTGDSDKQAKIWEKTVKADTVDDTGIINIAVTHSSQYQADQIAKAVNDSLKKTHSQYHGAGETVQIKTIDQPFTSRFPVKPNFYLNYVLSLVFGILSALTFIYIFPDERYDIAFWPGSKKVQKEIGDDEVYDFNEEQEMPEEAFEQEMEASPVYANNNGFEDNYSSEVEQKTDDIDLDYEEVVKRGRMENVLKPVD